MVAARAIPTSRGDLLPFHSRETIRFASHSDRPRLRSVSLVMLASLATVPTARDLTGRHFHRQAGDFRHPQINPTTAWYLTPGLWYVCSWLMTSMQGQIAVVNHGNSMCSNWPRQKKSLFLRDQPFVRESLFWQVFVFQIAGGFRSWVLIPRRGFTKAILGRVCTGKISRTVISQILLILPSCGDLPACCVNSITTCKSRLSTVSGQLNSLSQTWREIRTPEVCRRIGQHLKLLSRFMKPTKIMSRICCVRQGRTNRRIHAATLKWIKFNPEPTAKGPGANANQTG